MKNLITIFKLLLFPFFLSIQIHAATYEDAEPANDSCPGEALSTIVSGVTSFTGVIESAQANKGLTGIDYSQMIIPNDGNITITWRTDQNGKQASFLVGSSCDDDSYYDGSTRDNTHTTSTFPVNANDVIYLKIYDGEAKGYTITITYNIATPTVGSDLQITKVDSTDPVEIDEEFYYIIDVSNEGTSTATGVVVTDTLPSEGITPMEANTTKTNTASGFWSCNQPGGSNVVTCTHDNTGIPSGATHTIYLHVTAPSSAGIYTNNVEVTDANASSDTASEETTITAEIPNADNLCYIENTLASGLNTDINASCKLRGNFYYGDIGGQDDCIAQVIITDTNLSNDNITGLDVTKMYAPGLTNKGSATSTVGTVLNGGARTTLNIPSFPSYEEGYVVDVGSALLNDNNFTITDTASDYSPNVNGIALYADYNISNTHHFGRIYACSGISEGGIEINYSVDVIDTPIGDSLEAITAGYYNASVDTSDTGNNIKYIRTMVTASPTRTIEGVHLNIYGDATLYTPTNPDFNFIISPILVNDTCDGGVEPIHEAGTTEPLFIIVPDNAYSATGSMAVPSIVRKSARIQLIAIDPDSLSVEGQQCILSSSVDGNFQGVPSCANSEVQYSDAFGQDAWDRCGIDGGRPCESQNHGVADTSDPSYDPLTDGIYVNDYGCYLCTFHVDPVCSTDNFAIRPEKFDMTMSSNDAPNLLKAGVGYDIALTAKDALDNIPAGYTVTDHNFINDLDTNTTRYFKDGTEDTAGLLLGTPELNNTTVAYMVSGLSSLTTSNPGTAQEIVKVSYDDVGLIGLEVYDKEWAVIDDDDTPLDCNSSEHMYICGELNVTFIPDHFNVENIHLRNHKDGNYTYLSNDLNMSAHIDANISARNADDNITYNFKQGSLYYENPVRVDINITEWLGIASRHLKGNSTHKHDIPTETLLGFGGSDENGTHNIPWDESNTTQQLMFNYTRDNDQTVNPFMVDGTDLNITVQSTYTDGSTPSSPTVIEGSGIADRNATFYFGRAKSSKFFYDNISASFVTTPISVVVYCDVFPTCTELTDNIQITGKINEPHWWLSFEHVETTGDGNITLQTGTITPASGTATVTTDVNILTNAVDDNVVVTNTNGTVPMTVEIDLDTTPSTDTNSWLIYNPDSPTLNPDPFYKVRFIGQSGWAGHGKTGHVVDSNASKEINKRLSW